MKRIQRSTAVVIAVVPVALVLTLITCSNYFLIIQQAEAPAISIPVQPLVYTVRFNYQFAPQTGNLAVYPAAYPNEAILKADVTGISDYTTGGIIIDTTNYAVGEYINDPDPGNNLDWSYHHFDGWYTDDACTPGNEWDLKLKNRTVADADAIGGIITLYAKWTQNDYQKIDWAFHIATEGDGNAPVVTGPNAPRKVTISGVTLDTNLINHVYSRTVNGTSMLGPLVSWFDVNLSGCGTSSADWTNPAYNASGVNHVSGLTLPNTITGVINGWAENTYIRTVNGLNVDSINAFAFDRCSNLFSVNLQAVTTIGQQAFSECASLLSVYFPDVTSLGFGAFYDCTSLNSVYFRILATIGQCAFQSCTSLLSVTDADFPAATLIDEGAFSTCTSLDNVVLTQVTQINFHGFEGCSMLKTVDFPALVWIHNAFSNCTILAEVGLGSSVPVFTGTSCFNGSTPDNFFIKATNSQATYQTWVLSGLNAPRFNSNGVNIQYRNR